VMGIDLVKIPLIKKGDFVDMFFCHATPGRFEIVNQSIISGMPISSVNGGNGTNHDQAVLSPAGWPGNRGNAFDPNSVRNGVM
jgi:hypothetical protein